MAPVFRMSPVLRRIVVIAAGAALLLMGLTAGPLSAAKPQNKIFQVTVDPSTLDYNPAGQTPTFTVAYKNVTPGVSSFNSLTLTVPTGYSIADGAEVQVHNSADGSDTTVLASATAPNISVTNLYPVGYEQSVTLTFDATVTTTPSCSGDAWLPAAWTGSNLSGSEFQLDPSFPPPTTTVGTPLYPGQQTTNGTVTLTNVSPTTCSPVSITPVTISQDLQNIHVYKPTAVGDAFTVDVTWDPEPAISPMPWTQVDTPGGTHNIDWCIGTWDPAQPTDMTGITMPAGEVSCLLRQETNVAGTDASGNPLAQVQEWIYLEGDWGAQRG